MNKDIKSIRSDVNFLVLSVFGYVFGAVAGIIINKIY
jgi:hypothetical protein